LLPATTARFVAKSTVTLVTPSAAARAARTRSAHAGASIPCTVSSSTSAASTLQPGSSALTTAAS
jgi:hypothetical protein